MRLTFSIFLKYLNQQVTLLRAKPNHLSDNQNIGSKSNMNDTPERRARDRDCTLKVKLRHQISHYAPVRHLAGPFTVQD